MNNIEIEIVNTVKEKVEKLLRGETTGHDWFHTERVYKNAIKIAQGEEKDNKIDYFILEVSALLHDVADHKFGYTDLDRENIIIEMLQSQGVELERIKLIVNIVNNVSFSKGNIPESIEGKIVQDADRIDAIGAIGIARTFAYGGAKGREIYNPENREGAHSIYHFYEKLLLLKDNLNTKTAYNMALERNKFMESFLEEFYNEWNCGEKR